MRKTLLSILTFIIFSMSIPFQAIAESQPYDSVESYEHYLIKFRDVDLGLTQLAEESLLHRYQYIPFVKARLTPSEIQQLSANDNVEFIERDLLISLKNNQDQVEALNSELSQYQMTTTTNESTPSSTSEPSSSTSPEPTPEVISNSTSDPTPEPPSSFSPEPTPEPTIDPSQHPVPESESSSSKIKIAIIDSGVSGEPLVAGGVNFTSDQLDSYTDEWGQGTYITRIINHYVPDASLYAVRVFDENGNSTYSQIIQALEWSIENEMDIINISFSDQQYSYSLAEATYAASEKGLLLIAAAGDDSSDTISYPAGYTTVTSIGAVYEDHTHMPSSNTGTELDFVAVGSLVKELGTDARYASFEGTGLATAQVTSIAAQYLSAFPGLSAEEIRELLYVSSIKLSPIEQFGNGVAQFQLEPVEPESGEELDLITTSSGSANLPIPQFEGTRDEAIYLMKKFIEQQALRKVLELQDPDGKQRLAEERLRLDDLAAESQEVVASDTKSLMQSKQAQVEETLEPVNLSDIASSDNQSIFGDDYKPISITDEEIDALRDMPIPQSSLPSSKTTMSAQSGGSNIPPIDIPTAKMSEAPFSVGLYNENVSMLSGSVSISETDFVLPGRNGLSFALTRTYDSGSAQYFDISSEERMEEFGYTFKYSYITYTKRSDGTLELTDIYNGMHFYDTEAEARADHASFSRGDLDFENDNVKIVCRPSTGVYLHKEKFYYNITKENPINKKFLIGQGWSWNVPYIKTENGKKYVSVPELGTYQISGSTLVNYPWSDLTYANDSSVTYLGKRSSTVLMSVHGTKIYFDNDGNALQIKDNYNNFIGFGYSEIQPYGTVLTSISDSIGNMITIQYPTNQVVISYNNSTVTYTKGKLDGRDVLNQVVDQEGRKTTFSYKAGAANFSLVPGSSKANNYTLLTKIVHPTGSATEYTWETTPITRYFGSNGQYNQAYRIGARKDVVTYTNGQTKDFNVSTLVYTGDMGSQYNQNYSFSTKLFDQLLETTHTFEKRHFSSSATSGYYHTKSTVKDTSTNISKVSDMTYNMALLRTTPTKVSSYYTNAAGQSSPNKVEEEYTYDPYRNLVRRANSLGAVYTYTFDSTRKLKTSVEPVSATESVYTDVVSRNTQGDVKEMIIRANSATGPILQHVLYAYDIYGNLIEIQNKEANRTNISRVEYRTDGTYLGAYPTKVTLLYTDVNGAAKEQVTEALYNTRTGTILAHIDGKKNQTQFQYDKLNRLTATIRADGSTVKQQYFDLQNYIVQEDELARKSYVKWNPLGLLMESGIIVAGVMNPKVKNEYTATSLLDKTEDALGIQTQYVYDRWGRVTRLVKAGQTQSSTVYDDFLSTVVVTDPTGYRVRETSDAYGRVIKREEGQGTAYTTFWTGTYDWGSRLITQKDGKNYLTTFTYDPLGRLLTTRGADNQLYQYSYDRSGNMTQMTYPDGMIDKKEYDALGRLIKTIDPENKTEKYTYDDNGNVATYVDKKNQTFTYTYNLKRNWLEKKSGPGVTTEYAYALDGSRKTMKDNNGTRTTQYFYKPDTGYLDYIVYPDGKRINYSYDAAGDREQVTLPFLDKVNYVYNELKQVKQVNWNNVKQVEYSYLTNGKVNQVSYANGMKHQYSYTNGRLSQLLQRDGAGVGQREFTYTHDENGNITRRVEWVGGVGSETHQFTYDNMNRISTSSQFNESYTYDSRSNRKTLNTTSDAVLTLGTESYEYDAFNRLTKVMKNGKVVEYKYDGDDLLIERKENNVTTRYYYDGKLLVAEGTVQSNGTVTEKASYLQISGPVMMENGSGSKSYYMKNGHGDVVEVRSATGAVQNSYKYDIWGKTLQATETVSNPFRYSGELWDSSAELQYLRARWYDPSLGRFISEDTYKGDITNPLTLNLYTYVHHNPLRYTDPSGHYIYDDKNLNETDRAEIVRLTGLFLRAQANNDIGLMQTYHDQAVAIRLASGKYEMVQRRDYSTGKSNGIMGTPGGVKEDWLTLALAVPTLAAGIMYAPAVASSALAASDVATMGTTLSTGAVIAAQTINAGTKMVTLYRSMSEAEMAGIAQAKVFDAGFNMEGKWFATTLSDAKKWSSLMPGSPNIVSVTVPESALEGAFYASKLDNVGPAYYFDLDTLNSIFGKVVVVE